MLKKILDHIKNIFINYPKKHFYSLAIGLIFILILGLLFNMDLDPEYKKQDLLTEISIEELINTNNTKQFNINIYYLEIV